jgi:hypothetical protein
MSACSPIRHPTPSSPPPILSNEMATSATAIATLTLPRYRLPLLPLKQASIRWTLIGIYIFQFSCLACYSDFAIGDGASTKTEGWTDKGPRPTSDSRQWTQLWLWKFAGHLLQSHSSLLWLIGDQLRNSLWQKILEENILTCEIEREREREREELRGGRR